MKCQWYIEKEFFWEGQPDTILSVLEETKTPYYLQKFRSYEKEYKYDMYDPNDCVIVYGSIDFVKKVNQETAWIPGGTWMDKKQLLCSTYYAYFGKYLLNQKYAFMPLAEFKRKKDFFFDTFGLNNNLFIRPDSPYKEFTGFVASKEELDKRLITMSYGSLSPDLMILIATPQDIKSEFRLFISEGQVIASSRYKLNGEHDEDEYCPQEACEIAIEVSNNSWSPAPIYVVDIAQTYDNEYKLLEINSFNSSGMYLCNLKSIVAHANNVALNCWKEVHI